MSGQILWVDTGIISWFVLEKYTQMNATMYNWIDKCHSLMWFWAKENRSGLSRQGYEFEKKKKLQIELLFFFSQNWAVEFALNITETVSWHSDKP